MVEWMLGERRAVKGWPKILVRDRVDSGVGTEMEVPGAELFVGG